MGIASLVLGVISCILSLSTMGIGGGIGVILGIVGIILGAFGRKSEKNREIATGGVVCSCISTFISGIFFIACYTCGASFWGSGMG